jgi:adenosylhomocysteinase
VSTLTTRPASDRPVVRDPFVSDLPVLRQTAQATADLDCRLVLVAHALDTSVPYVRTLAEHLDLVELVPVPYSARRSALDRLTDVPATLPESIESVGRTAADAALRAARTPGAPVVLQEVGGYCAGLVSELAREPRFIGVVEDTKQGQWRYECVPVLPLPVFTIADSPLKALEDVQVGRSIASSVEQLLRTRFFSLLAERRVLVLGYGGIGTALADHVRRTGARVAVHDPDEVRMSAAVVHGYRVGQREELLGWADMIIGVSGHRSLSAEDVPFLRDGVVLASGSSKQVEFDVAGLRMAATGVLRSPEVEHLTVAGRTVHLLNEGKPVNFLDQSILGGILDLVYSELYLCTAALATGRHAPGMHRLEQRSQQELARRWREHYGQD